MHIPIGRTNYPGNNRDVIWNPTQAINGHVIIVGSSGSGKTYRLRHIIDHLARQNPVSTIHILDVHGDIAPESRNRVEFSEATQNGLNPLAIDPHPQFGGVRKRINSFISMINRTTHRLGSRQEATLRALLAEMYELKGYDAGNSATWRRSGPSPTINDLAILAEWRANNLVFGLGSDGIKAIQEVLRTQNQLFKLKKQGNNVDEAKFEAKKLQLLENITGFVHSIQTGLELKEVMRFDSLENIKAIYERVMAIKSAGIFGDNPPEFSSRIPQKVYDIKALQEDEQSMFAEVLLENIFIEAKARGPRDYPDTFVVIDEAHKFMSDDGDHILNRMSKEVRKFGVGLILVSQNFDHFSADLIQNTAMTMILGLHEMDHRSTAAKLMIDPKKLAYIKLQQTGIVQIRNKAGTRSSTNAFLDIDLAS